MKKLILCLLVSLPCYGLETKYSQEAELGMLSVGGNTQVEAYNFATKSVYEVGKYVIDGSGHYTLASTVVTDENGSEDRITTARNWDIKLGTEQKLNEKTNALLAAQSEGDEFAGINQRDNYDLGAKYFFHKTDKLTQFLEVGYRHTVERRIQRDEDGEDIFFFQKGIFYYERSQQVNEALSYKVWLQYIPNFTEEEDYLINLEPSVSVFLSKMFTLKVAYLGRYDNQPNVEGFERLDYTYTTSVIAKF